MDLYRDGKINYPTIRQFSLIEQGGNIRLDNARKVYFQFTLMGQATYQSDVTKFLSPCPASHSCYQ